MGLLNYNVFNGRLALLALVCRRLLSVPAQASVVLCELDVCPARGPESFAVHKALWAVVLGFPSLGKQIREIVPRRETAWKAPTRRGKS